MKKIVSSVLMVFVAAMLVGCSPKNSIVGKWNLTSGGYEKIEFFKEGTILSEQETYRVSGKYSFLDDSRIKVELAINPNHPFFYTVSFSGGELTMTDQNGKVLKYKRAN